MDLNLCIEVGDDCNLIDAKNDRRIFLFFDFMRITVFSYPDAIADIRPMRCGSVLVQVGDFEDTVIKKYGSPRHVETFGNRPGLWVPKWCEDDQGRLMVPYLLRSPIKK
ncbi:MAG: hypothetical protein QNJ04_04295 [Desulfobacterales bacterium]|nr:hypothetical protein [Desulfobacterales bacterium]